MGGAGCEWKGERKTVKGKSITGMKYGITG